MKAFINATFETMAAPAEGVLFVENGKILSFGREGDIPSDAQIIDCQGGVLSPGLIDVHTHLGVSPYAVHSSLTDTNERSAPVTAQVRALDAFWPGDEAIKEALAGGVTTVQVLPGSANVIGGCGCVMKLKGKVADQMVISPESCMKAALGENPRRVYGVERKTAPTTRMAVASIMRQTFIDAQEYLAKRAKDPEAHRDLAMEHLSRVLQGQMPLSLHAHRSDDICTAIRVAEEFGLKYTLEHCTEGHLIADYLAEKEVKAAIGPTMSNKSKMELAHKSWKTAGLLRKAGVHVCLITDHPVMQLGDIILTATYAARGGLSDEDAKKGVTLYAAEHLGLQDRIGSLEKGKDADFALFSREMLDLRGRVLATYINGEEVYRYEEN